MATTTPCTSCKHTLSATPPIPKDKNASIIVLRQHLGKEKTRELFLFIPDPQSDPPEIVAAVELKKQHLWASKKFTPRRNDKTITLRITITQDGHLNFVTD